MWALCARPRAGGRFLLSSPAVLTAELFSIDDTEAVCRIKAFLVHLQTA